MAFAREQQEALHILQTIENGTAPASTSRGLIDDADPALIYFIFTWLRSRYGGGHSAAEGVLGRLVELTDSYQSVSAKIQEGKTDSIVAWFEEEYSYKDFEAEAFIEIIVEKLEG